MRFLGDIPVMNVTVFATAAISANQLVGFNGAPTGDNAIAYGKAQTDAEIGEAVTLTVIGLVDMVAPAAIAVGDKVTSDANGAPKTAADPANAFATCVKAAANPGERCTLLIR